MCVGTRGLLLIAMRVFFRRSIVSTHSAQIVHNAIGTVTTSLVGYIATAHASLVAKEDWHNTVTLMLQFVGTFESGRPLTQWDDRLHVSIGNAD